MRRVLSIEIVVRCYVNYWLFLILLVMGFIDVLCFRCEVVGRVDTVCGVILF